MLLFSRIKVEDFVQLFTLFFSLCVSSTIINSRIFRFKAVHLQIHLLSAVVLGYGESALN